MMCASLENYFNSTTTTEHFLQKTLPDSSTSSRYRVRARARVSARVREREEMVEIVRINSQMSVIR